ncbi:MAG: hypothetical protein K6G83_08035 [Lachnospiraceae bacterium]|nr:hypothetical protein [Lachnospiraceae bacterium]
MIEGKGAFKDRESVSFTIRKTDLKEASAAVNPVAEAYKAKKKHNKVHPALYLNGTKLTIPEKDLTYTYLDETGKESPCIEEGSYTIRITAKASSKGYSGSVDIPMLVTKKPILKSAKVTMTPKSVKYTGEAVSPQFTLTLDDWILKENRDYTMAYADEHTDPGTHQVVFTGNGSTYFGQKVVSFTITGKPDLSHKKYTEITCAAEECSYRKGGVKTTITFRDALYKDQSLQQGKDYTAEFPVFDSASKAGTVVSVKLTGTGANFTGEAIVTYRIKPGKNDLSRAKGKVNKGKAYPYIGAPVCPGKGDIVLKLGNVVIPADAYEITGYFNNTKKGTASLTIVGKGDYYGNLRITYQIAAAKVD